MMNFQYANALLRWRCIHPNPSGPAQRACPTGVKDSGNNNEDTCRKKISRDADLTACAFPAKRRMIHRRNPATSATIGRHQLADFAVSQSSKSRLRSLLTDVAGTMRATRRISKLWQLGVSVTALIAISDGAQGASYAESLLGQAFDVHIRQIVAEGISQKDASYIAYAALARGSYKMCGDHLFPKSMSYSSYQQSLRETSVPRSVVDRHIRAFERIMQTALPNERAIMRYCSSKP